jgi:hypothetical protein
MLEKYGSMLTRKRPRTTEAAPVARVTASPMLERRVLVSS